MERPRAIVLFIDSAPSPTGWPRAVGVLTLSVLTVANRIY